jgi:hypothetical protein
MLALVPACLPLPSIFLSLTTLKYVIMGKKDTLRQTERRVEEEQKQHQVDCGLLWVAPLQYSAVYVHCCCIETVERIRREAAKQTGRSGARSDIKPIRPL